MKKVAIFFLVFSNICFFTQKHKQGNLSSTGILSFPISNPSLNHYSKYDGKRFSQSSYSHEISEKKILFDDSKTFQLEQSGSEWEPIGPEEGKNIRTMAVAPSSPNVIYAITRNRELFRSSDFGKNWQKIPLSYDDIECSQLDKIVVNPDNADDIIILAHDCGWISNFIYRSVNGGETWKDIFHIFAFFYDSIICESDTNHIFVAAYDWDCGLALYKSLDGGESWEIYAITEGYSDYGYGYAVAIDPNNDDIIYVGGKYSTDQGSKSGLFKTSDGGETWTEIGGDIPDDVYEIEIDPNSTEIICVGTDNGVYKSVDSGYTWAQPSLNFDVNPDCITINPVSPNKIFAGGQEGVYFSDDGGLTWQEFNSGLLCTHINYLHTDEGGILLYAGSSHEGIYKNKLVDSYLLAISASTGGTTDPSPGIQTYDMVTDVTVTAIPDTNYFFSSWSGDVPQGYEYDNPLTISVDSDKYINADFVEEKGPCFIAKAAYNSPFHPHLDTLREFKDRYLMTNKLGSKFVDLYYKYSPSLANFVAKHRILKLIIRISILPLVGFSYSLVHFGPIITAVIFVFIFVLPIFLVLFYWRRFRRTRAKILKPSCL